MNIYASEETCTFPTEPSPNDFAPASLATPPSIPTVKLPSIDESLPHDTPSETNDYSPTGDANTLLLVMSISVGDGKSYNLPVNENDDPYELAKLFCKEHNLNENVVQALAQNIYNNMEQVLEASVNQINPSYRESTMARIEKSPFLRQSGDFLEPEHKEERFKRGYDSEEEEMLEQIEKQFSEEPDDGSRKTPQKTFTSLPEHSNPRTIEKLDEFSTIAKLGTGLDSLHMDMSICSTIKLGEFIEENKLLANVKKMEQNQLISIKLQKVISGDTEPVLDDRFFSNPKLKTEGMEILKDDGQEKSLSARSKLLIKSNSEAKLNSRVPEKIKPISPLKNWNELMKATPRKSPNTDRGYSQLFQQKESQSTRQRSSEISTRSRNSYTLESSRAINRSTGNLLSNSVLISNRITQNKKIDKTPRGEEKFKIEEAVRPKSAGRQRIIESHDFKPKINKLSEKMIDEKRKQKQSPSTTTHQRLFNQHKFKESQQEQKSQTMAKECTFKPTINNYTLTPIGRTSFQERNINFQSKIKEQKEIRHKREFFDEHTGKPLFQPATGRGPATNRNFERLPIGEYLYNQRGNGLSVSAVSSTKDRKDAQIMSQRINEKFSTLIEKNAEISLRRYFKF